MLTRRIIPCLDVKNGRTVKGVKFEKLRDAGDPVKLACEYRDQGADEIVFLDISATNEKRRTVFELTRQVARELDIPFTIGGGISSVADAGELLEAGADKVSINTSAFLRPELVSECAQCFGSQFVIVAIDTRRIGDENRVHTHAGRVMTDGETVRWAKRAAELGAGEILVTSMDHDGTQSGFDLSLLSAVCHVVRIPVIASGGAGALDDFTEVFTRTEVDAALAASVFHSGQVPIQSLKDHLHKSNIPVRR